jgi:hypothetical protein
MPRLRARSASLVAAASERPYQYNTVGSNRLIGILRALTKRGFDMFARLVGHSRRVGGQGCSQVGIARADN